VCDAIVSCTVEPGADDTMVVHAKRGLKAVIDSDDLHVESFPAGLFVGNSDGLDYARRAMENNETTVRLTSLEKRFKEHLEDYQNLQSNNEGL
jgi:hypothetical protein